MSARILQDTAIRYFLEVVRCGSISEAAIRLNVAGSAISRQISGLEASLNTPLFERRKRGMIPSAAGELLAAYAFKNQLETERVSNEIIELQGMRRGEVRITSTTGFSIDFLPRAIGEFRERYTGIHFHLDVVNAKEVTRRLLEGESDIGLTFSQIPEPNINVQCRRSAPIYAVMNRDHPLADKQSLRLSQLAGYSLGMPTREIMMRSVIDACCSRQGLLIEPTFTTASMISLLSFASLNGGIIFSTELLVRHYLETYRLVAIPISDRDMNSLNMELHTLAGRTLPKAVSSFVDLLKERLQQESF